MLAVLTREHCWHECCKHEEEHTEEEAAGIVVGLAGLVTNAQVQQTNQNSHSQVRDQPQAGQRLSHTDIVTYLTSLFL